MNFDLLTNTILETHTTLQQSAVKAINTHLTIRNWLIGFYIVEYEQKGDDRAKYGLKLLSSLASRLKHKSLSEGNLKVFRQFYFTYPQLGKFIAENLNHSNIFLSSIRQSVIGELKISEIVTLDESSTVYPWVSPENLISKLSYTHLVQLFPIDNPIKRAFYEIEAIKGTWSVSELKRQIATLYFERSGMSLNPEKLRQLTLEKAEKTDNYDLIKSPFVFEFLGLKSHEAILENDIEAALVENLQEFMLELGHGFCYEARQKRILIDDEYYFIDLVFYHRILKCHVLVELKADVFKPEFASQLNTYVAYYNNEIKRQDDNPTIGILLCTQKGKKLVEYALAGMDKNLFVTKYLVELPTEQQFVDFINQEANKL
ncbi:PDDEXK nuclease domain-containing protein [Arcicella rigui]|uniref:PDDEXK nuclease domain-containing protein n=1 Tax=Arcicella rigui TaxID=797020 RepID=A0ABU5Q9R7_9BACT|nr:PDDEXK nuclease domain-containing protein [Arcicella rigui]MEA5139578.1 PDDEXK nuclease domain-containing protein [Arcicella rigui]